MIGQPVNLPIKNAAGDDLLHLPMNRGIIRNPPTTTLVLELQYHLSRCETEPKCEPPTDLKPRTIV